MFILPLERTGRRASVPAHPRRRRTKAERFCRALCRRDCQLPPKHSRQSSDAPNRSLSKRNRNAEESGRNRCGILTGALVVAIEQDFQLLLQLSSSTVLFRRFEGIHGGPVIFSKFVQECRRGAGIVECKRVSGEGDLFRRNPRGGKSFD